jgi:signal transduction histidine kinase
MLALQETAQAHGGTVRVERSDRGTTIGFSLPISV